MAAFTEFPAWIAQGLFAVLGLILGSFFNVLIYRVPRDLPIAFPPSHCPNCGARIRPWHNIPVLGWIWLRGRCHDCHTLISIQYPLVETLCGLLGFLSVRLLYPDATGMVDWARLLPLFWMLVTLVPIAAVDFPHHLIPDTVSFGGILLGLAVASLPGGLSWQQSLLGLAIAGGGLWGFSLIMSRLLGREAMGLGDVKLLAGFGAMLGWEMAVAALIGASFLALLVMIPWRMARGESNRAPLAFGPFIGLMGPIMLLQGDAIITAYWKFVSFWV
ncbi:MAG TPA: prepilin peptidase [Fibrobacteraceae bacterium]|nr:prepilin peptidase [Fibrobacteraceae bacterium]